MVIYATLFVVDDLKGQPCDEKLAYQPQPFTLVLETS